MKKIISGVIALSLLLGGSYLGFAKEKNPEEIGRSIAQRYLDNGLIDDNWKSSHPYIAGEYSYLSDKDTPAYKEYKVSCDHNSECGWIIVNIDGDDVSIPTASTRGSANYELLSAKLDNKLDKKKVKNKGKSRKAYYFSPFEQYIEDENGETESLQPGDNLETTSQDIEKRVKQSRDMKGSDTFKKRKKDLEERGLTSFSQKSFLGIFNSYASTTSVPNKFVTGAIITVGPIGGPMRCNSKIPCYQQFQQTYTGNGGGYCRSGCGPTALAMIYGYYDRRGGSYANLVPGTAAAYIDGSSTSNADITTLVNSLRTTMGTYCNNGNSSTPPAGFPLGINYAKSKGYSNATSSYLVNTTSTTNLLAALKVEVDADRPGVIDIENTTGGHVIVGYGYSTDTTSKMIRVNYGWGKDSFFYQSSIATSNADVNVDALTVSNDGNNNNLGSMKAIFRYNMGL